MRIEKLRIFHTTSFMECNDCNLSHAQLSAHRSAPVGTLHRKENHIFEFVNCCFMMWKTLKILLMQSMPNTLSICLTFFLDHSCSWYSSTVSFCEPQKWWEARRKVCFKKCHICITSVIIQTKIVM